jgi:hypothetical protein
MDMQRVPNSQQSSRRTELMTHIFLLLFLFLVVLEFELRASHLLGLLGHKSHSTSPHFLVLKYSKYTPKLYNQNNMVLARRQTYRPVEENREFRNKNRIMWFYWSRFSK